MEGTQQSGMPFELKISNFAQDGQMLEIARNTAMDILEKDPILNFNENKILAIQLKKMKTNVINWGAIS